MCARKLSLDQQIERLYEQGVAMYQSGDHDAAEEKLRCAESMAAELGSSGELILGQTLNVLGAVLSAKGQDIEAAEANGRSFELLKKHLSESDYDLAGVAVNAGRLYAAAGEEMQARRCFDEALRLMDVSLGPDHPQKAEVLVALARMHLAGDVMTPAAEEYLRSAFDQALKDEWGETLQPIAQEIAGIYMEASQFDRAREMLEETLEAQDRIYSQSFEPLVENPTWVLNPDLARQVVLRKGYQVDRFSPYTMMEVRCLLAGVLAEMELYEEAVRVYEQIESEIVRYEAEERNWNSQKSASRRTEFGDGSELKTRPGVRDYEEIKRTQRPMGFFLDLAEFYNNFGAAWHFRGQHEKRRLYLEIAREKYLKAKEFIAKSKAADQIAPDLEANLAELEDDILNVTN